MLKRLRNRLLLVNLVGLSIVMAACLSIIYLFAYGRAQNDIESQLRKIPPSVIENIVMADRRGGGQPSRAPDGEGMIINGDPIVPTDYTKSFVANIHSDGQISIFSRLDMTPAEYSGAVAAALSQGGGDGALRISGREWRFHLDGGGAMYESSVVFLDVDDTARALRSLALSLVVIGSGAVCSILFVSMLVANRAIAPVEAGMERQRRFVSDASHELKTPLAVIAMNAEAASGPGDPAPWLCNIEAETTRMGKLIEGLMDLARIDEAAPVRRQTDFAALAHAETERARARLFERGVMLDVHLPEKPLFVETDAAKLAQAMSVVLDNAVKYTPPGGRVDVSAYARERKACFAVANSGELIAPSDLAHVFDRFYRADRSRNSGSGGHGIGLSIAKAAMDRIGGDISAESVPAAGDAINTFTLRVPMG